jgi:hypothetical protein
MVLTANRVYKENTASVAMLARKVQLAKQEQKVIQVLKAHRANKDLLDKLSQLTTKANKASKAQLDPVVKKAIKETLVKLAQWDHKV